MRKDLNFDKIRSFLFFNRARKAIIELNDAIISQLGGLMCAESFHQDPVQVNTFSNLNTKYVLWTWDLEEGCQILTHPEIEKWKNNLYPEDAKQALTNFKHFVNSSSLEYEDTYRTESIKKELRTVFTKAFAERSGVGQIEKLWGIHIDITEQLHINGQLYQLSNYDRMTKLPNASKLWEDFGHFVEPYQGKKTVYMVCLDVDNFNYINNKLGYHVGNQIIIKIASLLKACTEENDYLARVSGDEFILVFARRDDGYQIEHELRNFVQFMRENLYLPDSHTQVTVSVGCSVYNKHASDLHSLLQKANTALYYAKKTGKNQFKLYENNLEQFAYHNLDWKQQLRDAIREEGLEMYFQPIYSCDSMALVGLESLCRWYHPEKGYIPPTTFIKIAEESELIIDLEKWILKSVFKQLEFWNKKYGQKYFVTINLSAKCMTDYDLRQYLCSLLKYYMVMPNQIEFEITETNVLKNIDLAMKVLEELRNLGFRIALDDFGTGYSSLNYLRNLPIDKVKLDKSFLDEVANDLKNQLVVKSIIELSKGLCIETVAEGVEREEQVHLLKTFSCDYLQGYYFSRPLPVPKIERLIEENE